MKKEILQLKKALEKKHGRVISDDELDEIVDTLKQLASIAIEIEKKKIEREKTLKQTPNGFHFSESGTCEICGETKYGDNLWFDKYGLKCLICQEAVNKKIILGSITKDRDSWYSEFDMDHYFNIKGQYLKKLIRTGFLNVREIRNNKNRLHLLLFLRKENLKVLPPRSWLKGGIIREEEDGKEYFTSAKWYEIADEKLIHKIKKYHIARCFKDTLL